MDVPAAAVAIVRAEHPEPSVLLIRRSERADDPWSGHWSFPGGRRDSADPDLLHTALRELEEECGIHLASADCAGQLPDSVARRQAGPFLLVAPYLIQIDRQLPTVLDPKEAAHATWVPLRLLGDPSRHLLRAVPGRPRHTLFPAVDLEGPPLWGFTYRLIAAWLGLEPSPGSTAAVAQQVLDFLLSCGLTLAHPWNGNTARVRGTVPVDAVLARYTAPGAHVLAVNRLEVLPASVHLTGLRYEDYLITTRP